MTTEEAQKGWLQRLHEWRVGHVSDKMFLLILAIMVGLLTAVEAYVLHGLINTIVALLTGRFAIDTYNWLYLVYPVIGIYLTSLFVRYVVKDNISHGITRILYAISSNRSRLKTHNTWSSVIASAITIGFGGSVGAEAPIVLTGSAIGSNLGRLFQMDNKTLMTLVGCGAAGAIAGIFKAPFAGVLFVLEVFMFDLTATTALPLLIAALTASTVAYFTMGTEVQFKFTVEAPFALSQLPFYAVLGVFCAMVSLYFLRVTDHVEGWFAKRKSPWVKMLTGGLVLGAMVVLFPPLYGEGYAALTNLLHGNPDSLFAGTLYSQWAGNTWAIVIVLFVLIMLKAIATATTIGSGGVGGTFGPSLVLGGLSGYFIATLGNQLGLPPQDTANFALVGMAAVMTGVMHAPFMATFLIADITGGYGLLVPLLTASAVTYLCISPFERHSIYARKLAKHGDLLTHDKDSSAWNLMNMQSLIETNFVIVRSGDRLRDLVEAIKTSRRNIFPVLSDDDKFLGVIVLDDVRNIIFNADLYDSVTVDDLMHPLSEGDLVRNSDSLTDVVEKFRIGNRYNLVVIDDQQNYLGFLSRANTFSAYRRFISATSDE